MENDRHFANTLSDTSPTDQYQFVDQLNISIEKLFHQLHKQIDAHDNSVYTGISGIALIYRLFYKLSKKLPDSLNFNFKQMAVDLVAEALKRLSGKRVSFLCGDAGPLAIGAVVFFEAGMAEKSVECVRKLLAMHSEVVQDKQLPNELLYGRCGYLYALMFVRRHLGSSAIDEKYFRTLTDVIVQDGIKLAKNTGSECPLLYEWHESYYLGAAHGLSGIFFLLMRSPSFQQDAQMRQLVKSSVDYLITLRFPSGNYPSSFRSAESDKLVHWCHGAPGFIHMFLEAYKAFGDQKYLAEAVGCAEVIWRRGLLKKGYGLCHGVAGNGYAFLMLYQTTKDEKYLSRALKFAEWIFDYGKHGCRTADHPFSLFEGMAGSVYYLVDLLQPESAEFPAFY